jgi:hypothetical protein
MSRRVGIKQSSDRRVRRMRIETVKRTTYCLNNIVFRARNDDDADLWGIQDRPTS